MLSVAFVLNACTQDKALETPNVENPVLMLRLSMQNTSSEEVWAQTYSILTQNPGCCDEVWFSTGTGMPDMQVHRDHVSRLVKAKEALRELGIGSSLQIQMTIGHGDQMGMEQEWEAKTWTGWTGSTGVEDKFCNCPRQVRYLDYIRTMTRLYAQIHPHTLWIDDDLRYDNHIPATYDSRIGCWCATCLAAFSTEEGKDWTREALDSAMDGDEQLAERWKAFSIESLRRIAQVIAEETKAVSPETRMGYQKTFWDGDTTVVRAVLQTLAQVSGRRVAYRAGGGAYYDKLHPAEQIIKSMDAARFMRVLGNPEYVESWCPEIESWPRHYGSRTAQAVLLEAFTGLAYGMDAVSMFVIDSGQEEADLQARSMLFPLADGAPMLRSYAQANRGTEAVGYRTSQDNYALYEFGTLGIPILPGNGRSLGMLEGDNLKPVNIYSQPSSAVQDVRCQMDAQSPAPVLCQSPFVGLLIPRVTADGTLRTIGLLNGRIDEQGPLRLSLRSLPQGVRSVVWHQLRRKPLRLDVLYGAQGESYIEIPSLSAWNAGFVEIPL